MGKVGLRGSNQKGFQIELTKCYTKQRAPIGALCVYAEVLDYIRPSFSFVLNFVN